MNTARKKLLRSATIFFVIFFATILLWNYLHNFGTVVNHEVYRARQPSPAMLAAMANNYQLKSIINLRGSNPKEKWYQDELAESRHLGLQHFDIALESEKLPSRAQMENLATLIATAPKPVLIHCENGADRSGLAAVFALLEIAHPTMADLQRQVSWHYFVFSKQSVGRQFLNLYIAWLKKQNLEPNNASLTKFLAQ